MPFCMALNEKFLPNHLENRTTLRGGVFLCVKYFLSFTISFTPADQSCS